MRKTLLIMVILLSIGCAHVTKKAVGEEWPVSSTGNRPSWTQKVPELKDGRIFFVGRKSYAVTEEGGLNDAREDAARQLAEMIMQKVNVDYEKIRYEVGMPLTPKDVGSVTKDIVISLTKAMVKGMKDAEVYTEKWNRMEADGKIQTFYNCYVLRSISEDDYRDIARQVIEEKLQAARRERNEKAEKILEEFRKEVMEEQKKKN